jgi:epsilon-lactone hydrolase
MASPELAQLIAGLRAGGLDFTRPPAQTRAEFEAILATLPEPEGVRFVEGSLGGSPALECHSAEGADPGALLYLHGGGYVSGSARGYRGLAARLGRAMKLKTYAIDYRLAPEAPCPAAVEDAVRAYRGLLGRGERPGQIVIAGDSAGGGLTLATLMTLRDEGVELPAAAVLLSPWADLACEGASFRGKAEEDPSLTPDGLLSAAAHYLGGAEARSPLASPIHGSLWARPRSCSTMRSGSPAGRARRARRSAWRSGRR